MKRTLRLFVLAILPISAGVVAASSVQLNIEVDKPGGRINPAMWGIFFEDINFGADGGLYAELVKNRSFEFPDPFMGWTRIQANGAVGSIETRDQDSFDPDNPHYLRFKVETPTQNIGLSNEGFRGMGVRHGTTYELSLQARSIEGGPLSLRAELVTSNGRTLASTKVNGLTRDWRKHTAVLRPAADESKARLNIWVEGRGTVDLDWISLFPKQTWKNRPNGLRADLVQMLADMKPGFMRFPGGCIVEGRRLPLRYQWKTTIGAPEDRRLIINRWNDEFKHRPAPDYFQSFGLGFYEFFLLCEDIGASPLPILNCGMACQFNSGELVPLEQLDPFIQDALDLIEFANGPVTSIWGGRRAQLGHPAPFGLKLLGIGNEQWGAQYIERYERFAKALKQSHPEISLVSSAGPAPADDRFQFAWGKLRELHADIIDEHCYATPDWFLDNSARYDNYDRNGPKVFMGEYAAQSVKTVSPDNRNNWECALAEAAYMIGLERNSDEVVMASYAPLFGHVDAWQWTPNLIWCDNLRVFGTPNYYVQQLFSVNRGDVMLPVSLSGTPVAENGKPRFYATASREDRTGTVIIKVVNATATAVTGQIEFSTTKRLAKKGETITLAGAPKDENTLDNPKRVAPVHATLDGIASGSSYSFKPLSFTVLRIPVP